ncbi:MAG: aminotransferase class I/II-fold pyridoxal phosphate-dependent enzyme [Pseudomonadota bacterium]
MTGQFRFSDLPEYAFPRLRRLLDGVPPGGPARHLSIGEPKHEMPPFLADHLAAAVAGFAKYPNNNGIPELLEVIGNWLKRRFQTDVDPESQVMVLNGTREGLFNAVLALTSDAGPQRPAILIPNPFYQVYAVGALAAQADPIFVNATKDTGFLPDYASLPEDILDRTAIAFVCTPSNPQGAIASVEYLSDLIDLAEKHDFIIFSDECYSEIYSGTPPPGLLEVMKLKSADPNRGLVFHSLSKRSNLPGLRSGFVAGGAELISELKRLRAYAGAPLPEPIQSVSAAVWADEAHVKENRARYQRKYKMAQDIFASQADVTIPEAGFFLWLPVPNGEDETIKIWRETGIRVLPGSYLSRKQDGTDPGEAYIRVAMVAEETSLEESLINLRDTIYGVQEA